MEPQRLKDTKNNRLRIGEETFIFLRLRVFESLWFIDLPLRDERHRPTTLLDIETLTD